MKTPREILLERHQAIDPKLDALRREILARQFETSRPINSGTNRLNLLWQELFWSCRRTWTSLAAIWVILLLLNLSQRDPASVRLAQSQPSAVTMMSFRDQEALLQELLADRTSPLEAVPARPFEPKPRSEISRTTAV